MLLLKYSFCSVLLFGLANTFVVGCTCCSLSQYQIGQVSLFQSVENANTIKTFALNVPNVPFDFLPSQLPGAGGAVTWQKANHKSFTWTNRLLVQVNGLPSEQNYRIFLTEKAVAPFGKAVHIANIRTDDRGNGKSLYIGEVKNVFIFEWSSKTDPSIRERTDLNHLVILAVESTVIDKLFKAYSGGQHSRFPSDVDREAGIAILSSSTDPDTAGPLQ